jgi:hypothetical protein
MFTLSYEFDQSVYVINAVKSLIVEGAIGAILTGLMVLLFLRDRRAALIVILTIPTSVIAGVLFLKIFGQTINIMSLSGLALSIGILVDESTVTIENIHQHFAMGKSKALAIWDACQEIALPKLLILFLYSRGLRTCLYHGRNSRSIIFTIGARHWLYDGGFFRAFPDFCSCDGELADEAARCSCTYG